MKQYIFGIHPSVAIANAPTDQGWRISLGLQDSLSGFNSSKLTIRAAGTFRNLNLRLNTPMGAGVSATWALEKNGVDTGLAVTLTNGPQLFQNTTDAVHVDVGDNVCWHPRLLPGPSWLGSRLSLCVEFDSDVPNECNYGRSAFTIINNRFSPIFHQQGRNSYTDPDSAKDVMGVPGTITELYVATLIAAGASGSDMAPGVGESFSAAIYKNHIRQDGTGGTVDTVATVADLNVNNLKTFSLPVVAGDLIYIGETNTGGLPNFINWRGSIKFVSADDTSFSICSSMSPATSKTNPTYIPPQIENDWVTSITEALDVMVGPITPLMIGGMIGDLEIAPGDPTEGIHYRLRKNWADAGLQLDFIGSQTTDLASGSPVVLTSNDVWTISKIGTGATPSSGGDQAISFPGLVATGSPPEPEPEPAPGVIGPLVWVEWPRRVTT